MALPRQISETLAYFDKYNYPLTRDELWHWQHGTQFTKTQLKKFAPNSLAPIRRERLRYSREKWFLAVKVGESLKKIPTIAAIFVTGALAMNNCPKDDDIDFMIVTFPNTLWITRFFVNLFLCSQRRFPKQKSAPNKICPNLWLDTNYLKIQPQNLYTAHEILQAKVLWDRDDIHHQFLSQNCWVEEYLPVAYHHLTLGPSPEFRRGKAAVRVRFLLWPINFLFFLLQYLYMLPKKTIERVGLHYAFFHPTPRT